MSDMFVTMVNSRFLPSVRFFSFAYFTTCCTTVKFTSGSPPWNSIVTNGDVLRSARSTDFSASSGVMSVCVASMFARDAWQ